MGFVDTLVVFIVSLLIGGFGIYIGGRVLTGVDSYEHAVFTAAVGALVWAIVSFFLGWIPLLGPILTFLAYLWVVNRRYPGGWITAAGITLVAWVVVLVVLWVLATLGVTSFQAAGVPGT